MEKEYGNIKAEIEYPSRGILSKEIVDDEKLDVTLFCMAKGTKISEHAVPKRGFIYVIEGKGIFNLEGRDIEMEPGVFIKLEENAKHALRAEENLAFLLTLVR